MIENCTAGGRVAGLRRPGRDVSTVTVPEAAGGRVAPDAFPGDEGR